MIGDHHGRRASRATLLVRAVDDILGTHRLQTDYIDLYQFHHVDRATPWDEIWQAIDVAVTAGKMLYVGSRGWVSRMWVAGHAATMNPGARSRNIV
jgi:NDP-hexose C3-ketoreductase / dTDP-4-oxo-2-deoxy-alpha-D-pentos-2-ene 2,3-reductase